MALLRSDFTRHRWAIAAVLAATILSIPMLAAVGRPAGLDRSGANGASPAAEGGASPALTDLAADHPNRRVEVIVQLQRGTSVADGKRLVSQLGGSTTGTLHVINGLAARMTAADAKALGSKQGVRVVSLNAPVKKTALGSSAIDSSLLATSYPLSVQAPKAWSRGATGAGVGVAVIDSGIAGDLADFRKSATDSDSRVAVTAVTNPDATNDYDRFGHGTHVAGILAGNSFNRAGDDPLRGRYVGVAPDANLISVKIADDEGGATVLDAIYGLQFAVDFKDDYNIRVVNLSLESGDAQSYKTDPLDAAAEAAWFHGIVVVAAAGNRGTDADAVDYAPGNDPYVVTVGAVDDQGTKNTLDDTLADWSSRGTTQDGIAKPDVLAPGAHIVSNLAPESEFASLSPTSIVSGEYIRAGGTSMAAPVVSGAVADLLQVHPGLTPDEVKGTLVATARKVPGGSIGEVSAGSLAASNLKTDSANEGLTPNTLIDPSTGDIDYSRSNWSRSNWSRSNWSRSNWSRSNWSRSNWSRSNWSRSNWSRSNWSRSNWSMSWAK